MFRRDALSGVDGLVLRFEVGARVEAVLSDGITLFVGVMRSGSIKRQQAKTPCLHAFVVWWQDTMKLACGIPLSVSTHRSVLTPVDRRALRKHGNRLAGRPGSWQMKFNGLCTGRF